MQSDHWVPLRECNAVQLSPFVGAGARLRLAREELKGAAFILNTRVIVDVFREQARSYNGRRRLTEQHYLREWGLAIYPR